MLNNFGCGNQVEPIFSSGNIPSNTGAICWAVGYQQIINAIRATGAANVVAVGTQNYTGEPETWSYNGGPMHVTDTLVAPQIAVALHGYGYNKGFANLQTLKTNGLAVIATELGTLANIPSTYTQFRSSGFGYSWWSWKNYGSSADIYPTGMTGGNTPWSNNGSPAPTGTN